jgi:MFS family permease
MFGGLFFLSLYAQDHPAIRADPTTTGMLLSVGAFGQVAAAPLSGILVQRTGYRIMTVTGLALATLSFVFMAYLPTRLELLAVLLLANRFGGTLAAIPLTAAGLEAFESSAGAISGIRQMSNVLGGAFGPVALGALLSTSGGVPENRGFSEVFSLLGILCLVAIFVCKFLPNREREIRGKA